MTVQFLREPVEFDEGDLIEILTTGERIRFGKAEYCVNWRYGVHDRRGNYFGQLNKGELKLIEKAQPLEQLQDKLGKAYNSVESLTKSN